MPPNEGPFSPSALLNIGNTLQSVAQNIVQAVSILSKFIPTLTSGQLSANTLVQTGTIRVIGISVVVGNAAAGGLYDASTIAGAGAGQQIYQIPSTAGYYPVQMLLNNGLVYKTGTSEKIAIFYGRA